jgi:hypothetical protein
LRSACSRRDGKRATPGILFRVIAGSLCGLAAAGPAGTLSEWPVTFTDVAREAGLIHATVYGGVDRKRFIIETNGAGVALVDVDRDGWLDVLTLSGTRLSEGARADAQYAAGEAPTNRLYKNRRDGTFEDVTDRAGLVRTGWASSVCAGDYDNDGWIDLFVTYYGRNVLYRNRGDGRFEDMTRSAGLPDAGVRWGSGCAFTDIDRDGRLDLFVANYLRFDLAHAPEPGAGPNCTWKGLPVNCGPKGLPTDTNLLYHNEGGGRFTDVSERSGIARVTGRYSMTAVAADVNGDDWPDIYVASDSTASILYRNNRDGTFTDVAVESGTAYNEHRHVRRTQRAESPRGMGRRPGRLRQRRLHRSAVRHGQCLSGNRTAPAALSSSRPAHRLPQQGRRAIRGRVGREWSRRVHAPLEPRGCVRRRGQRRRCRCARDEHERTALAAA